MPRRRRFKTLNAALKTLIPVGAAPGTAAADPPAGTVLEFFDKRTSRNIVYGNIQPERVLNNVNVNPFGIAFAAGNKYQVPMSSRIVLGTLLTAATDVAHAVDPAGGPIVNRLFIPAKAIIFLPGTQGATLATSKITGRRYNPREGASYTVPFGRAADTEDFKTRKQLITDSVLSKTPGASVSFQPEDGRYL